MLPNHVSLEVGIVGAGIAGLSAAIALSRAGHRVEVFEKSTFANEIGAAINVCPNATRILKSWDFDFDAWSPSECKGQRVLNPKLEILTHGTCDFERKYGSKFYLYHRADLHNGLRHLANQCGVVLRLSAPVEAIEYESGMLRVRGGGCYQKDLVVVADGLHVSFTASRLWKWLTQSLTVSLRRRNQRCCRNIGTHWSVCVSLVGPNSGAAPGSCHSRFNPELAFWTQYGGRWEGPSIDLVSM